MKKAAKIFLIIFLGFSISAFSQEYQWFKGNTHTHTTNSDGDMPPDHVVNWYKNHGYNFLVLSDHNLLTDIRGFDTGTNDSFILIPGDEVSDKSNDKPVHVVGINVNWTVKPMHGTSIISTLQNNIYAINRAGGIAQIAHPNFGWAFTHKEISGLKDVNLIEIYNYHPAVNNYGNLDNPGMEEMWDNLLSEGHLFYGIMADDAHNYKDFTRYKANPGRGWIVVKSEKLDPKHVTEAIAKGEFYSSCGVQLNDIKISDKEYSISIKQISSNRYTTQFIGKNGKVLKEMSGRDPVYVFKGGELYIRAKILSSSGNFALTQPVFPR
ncbi:PHP domain-containing protein [candidate division KSB1 bacterium]